MVAFRGGCGGRFVVIGVVVIAGCRDGGGIWVARCRVRRRRVEEGEIVGGHRKIGLGLRFRFGGWGEDVRADDVRGMGDGVRGLGG